MDYSTIEKDAEAFVRTTNASHQDRQFAYHNLEHTIRVVEHAGEIGLYYQLLPNEFFVIRVAAWFHDIGHLFGGYEGHEERGVGVMQKFLGQYVLPADMLASMTACIRATKFPSHPGSLYEKILCDSDTFHFGTLYFRVTDGKVRQEVEQRMGKSFPEWHKKSIWLLEHHHFFTEYCQRLLEEGKQDNIRWLRSLPD